MRKIVETHEGNAVDNDILHPDVRSVTDGASGLSRPSVAIARPLLKVTGNVGAVNHLAIGQE